MNTAVIHIGDCLDVLRTLPAESVQTCITSPPYWRLRDYGHDGQIGLESTPEAYVERMVEVFREVRRVLRDDGTCWLNLGDSYSAHNSNNNGWHDGRANRGERLAAGLVPGLKPKDLVGIPWRAAFALQADGWYLRQDLIWAKPNPMPESVTDRCTKAHEYIFLLSKSARYYYDHEAIKEPASCPEGPGNIRQKYTEAYEAGDERHRTKAGLTAIGPSDTRNRRSVWTVATQPFPGAHFAVFPPALIEPCVLAGSRPGDTVLDPFSGAGTTGLAALGHGRNYVGIELNPEYAEMSRRRLAASGAMFFDVQVTGQAP